MTAIRRYLAVAILLLGLGSSAFAQPSGTAGTKILAPFAPIVAKANTATVRILCDDKDAILGTVVSPDGYILTKASELKGAVSVKFGDGSLLDAETVSIHKPTDLALLKIDMKGLQAVKFDDSKKEPIGNWLAAAGVGKNPTAVGIVSVMTRDLSGVEAKSELNANRGFLGVQLAQTDDPDGGVKVDSFGDNSAAKKAGVKLGDTIIAANGKTISGAQALFEVLNDTRPGMKIKITVRRKDKTADTTEEHDFTVTLGGPQADRSAIQNNMGGELSGRRTGFPTVLQTDMILDPKNCGGPVVDLDGKVLGISIARAGRVETWILPSETIRPLLVDMKAGKFPVIHTEKKSVLPSAPAPRLKKK
jgi:serine protease Do